MQITLDEKLESENEAVNVFCRNLLAKTKVNEGENSKKNAKNFERFTTENFGIAYKKIIYKKQVYTSCQYNRSSVFKDCYVGINAEIQHFLEIDCNCICYVKLLETGPFVSRD